MNYKMIGRFNAQILCIEAIFMLPALLICLLDTNMRAAWGFVMGIAALMIVSSLLFLLSRNAEKDFYAAEGMLSVSLGWILMSLLISRKETGSLCRAYGKVYWKEKKNIWGQSFPKAIPGR